MTGPWPSRTSSSRSAPRPRGSRSSSSTGARPGAGRRSRPVSSRFAGCSRSPATSPPSATISPLRSSAIGSGVGTRVVPTRSPMSPSPSRRSTPATAACPSSSSATRWGDGPRCGRPATRRCAAWWRWRRGCRAPSRSSSSPVATSWCCTAPGIARPARAPRRGSSLAPCRSLGAPRVSSCRGAVTGCCRARVHLASPHRRVHRRHRGRRAVRASARARTRRGMP